jgi:hypothetical protein
MLKRFHTCNGIFSATRDPEVPHRRWKVLGKTEERPGVLQAQTVPHVLPPKEHVSLGELHIRKAERAQRCREVVG